MSRVELPFSLVLLQLPAVADGEGNAPLLERIDPGPLLVARLERPEPRRAHQPCARELPGPLDVHRAPDAARPAGGEADRVAGVVEAAAGAGRPPETPCLIHGLGPGDAWLYPA